jgi:hypothetical protein
MDLIWLLVLQSGNPEVTHKSVEFLIQIYTQLDDSIADQRGLIAQQLITKCFELLEQDGDA